MCVCVCVYVCVCACVCVVCVCEKQNILMTHSIYEICPISVFTTIFKATHYTYPNQTRTFSPSQK